MSILSWILTLKFSYNPELRTTRGKTEHQKSIKVIAGSEQITITWQFPGHSVYMSVCKHLLFFNAGKKFSARSLLILFWYFSQSNRTISISNGMQFSGLPLPQSVVPYRMLIWTNNICQPLNNNQPPKLLNAHLFKSIFIKTEAKEYKNSPFSHALTANRAKLMEGLARTVLNLLGVGSHNCRLVTKTILLKGCHWGLRSVQ